MRDEHVPELLVAYALGATMGEECARVEAHVAECGACRAELAALQEDAALLGASAHEAPPLTLRARVLDHVSNQPQHAPTSVPLTAPTSIRTRRERRPWRTFAMPACAAATVLLAVATGVQSMRVSNLRSDLDSARRAPKQSPSASAPAGAMLAQDTTTIETNGQLAKAVAIVGSTNGSSTMLLLEQMPQPPIGKSWQVWAIDSDGRMLSMSVMEHGAPVAVLQLPHTKHPIAAIAITLERAGGAKQPTTAPLAYGAVAV